MARLHFLFALATITVAAIAALSSEALTKPAHIVSTTPFHPKHHHAAGPSPDEYALPPVSSYPGFYSTCMSKVSDKCRLEIYKGVFENNMDGVSVKCCQQVVKLGRRCHKGMVREVMDVKGVRNVDMTDIENRELEVWQQCVLYTNLIKVGDKPSL